MLLVHAGLWLKSEIVALHGANVKDLAAHFGVPRQALSTLLNSHASLRFEKAFGVNADALMRMQTAYDLAQAHTNEAEIKVSRLEMAA
ncbi:helix-turn-helix transcriptional regulator [Rhizorhabdus argentea]|uniref:helix-turn-helix transcriptional regulator n=1 Tax=Rhizorhabdus argentea TaxID=1387174 RepID=UPI0030EDCC98